MQASSDHGVGVVPEPLRIFERALDIGMAGAAVELAGNRADAAVADDKERAGRGDAQHDARDDPLGNDDGDDQQDQQVIGQAELPVGGDQPLAQQPPGEIELQPDEHRLRKPRDHARKEPDDGEAAEPGNDAAQTGRGASAAIEHRAAHRLIADDAPRQAREQIGEARCSHLLVEVGVVSRCKTGAACVKQDRQCRYGRHGKTLGQMGGNRNPVDLLARQHERHLQCRKRLTLEQQARGAQRLGRLPHRGHAGEEDDDAGAEPERRQRVRLDATLRCEQRAANDERGHPCEPRQIGQGEKRGPAEAVPRQHSHGAGEQQIARAAEESAHHRVRQKLNDRTAARHPHQVKQRTGHDGAHRNRREHGDEDAVLRQALRRRVGRHAGREPDEHCNRVAVRPADRKRQRAFQRDDERDDAAADERDRHADIHEVRQVAAEDHRPVTDRVAERDETRQQTGDDIGHDRRAGALAGGRSLEGKSLVHSGPIYRQRATGRQARRRPQAWGRTSSAASG